MTMKTTTSDKIDITLVEIIEDISNASTSPSIAESKTSTITKGTKTNEDNLNVSEDKNPEEVRFNNSYEEMNIEEFSLKRSNMKENRVQKQQVLHPCNLRVRREPLFQQD